MKDVLALLRELFGGWEPKLDLARYQDALCRKDSFVFIHRENGKAVAMVALYCIPLLSRRLAVIEEVATLPAYRRLGFSRGLLEQALAAAKTWGADVVELTTRQNNIPAQRLFESLGFKDRQQKAMRLILKP